MNYLQETIDTKDAGNLYLVPEPSTTLMLWLGLAALATRRRKLSETQKRTTP